MRKYELTYLVSDEANETELTKVTGEVGGLISGLDGKIIKEESWGRRKLAYPINKINFATYITVYFEVDPEKINAFKKDLVHIKYILRHLIIVKDYSKEKITLSKEDVAASQELVEVAGGEKSLETATEKDVDSRDLMTKREKKDEENEEAEADKDMIKKDEKKAVKNTTGGEKTEGKKAKEKKKPTKKIEKSAQKTKKAAIKTLEKKVTPKKSKAENEADRLTKLDEELDELLKDEI